MNKSTELIVLTFTQENKADETLRAIQHLIDVGLISILDIAVLVKHKDGRLGIKDIQDVRPAHGTLFGAIMGGVIGTLAGPAGIVMGAIAGATTGGLAAHVIDFGFPGDYLKELQGSLLPGSSILVILTKTEWSDRVVEAITQFGGRMIQHVLKEDMAAYLAAVIAFDNDPTPAAELPAKLEAQINIWQAEIKTLIAKSAPDEAAAVHPQLVNLRTSTRLAQGKLQGLWMAEIQELTRQIETLQLEANATPPEAKANIITQMEETRLKRRAIREKLYAQIEDRIKSWQIEIEELKTKSTKVETEKKAPVSPRIAALQRFADDFDDPVLPSAEEETRDRVAALHAKVETAEMELQNLYETQIATWQATIKDLQAYQAIPDITNGAEIAARITELQHQITTVQAKLTARNVQKRV